MNVYFEIYTTSNNSYALPSSAKPLAKLATQIAIGFGVSSTISCNVIGVFVSVGLCVVLEWNY